MVQWLVDGTSHIRQLRFSMQPSLPLCDLCGRLSAQFPRGISGASSRRGQTELTKRAKWGVEQPQMVEKQDINKNMFNTKKQFGSNKNGAKSGNSIIAERVIDSCRASGKKLSCFLLLLCLLCYYHHFLLFVMLFVMLVFSPFGIFAK